MRSKTYPKVDIREILVFMEDIQGCFPAKVITRGTSFYLRLDTDFMRFWEVKQGDQILVSVTKLKRIEKVEKAIEKATE